jgi:peptidoglycan/LPS O-acetylase OafA/YrhL
VTKKSAEIVPLRGLATVARNRCCILDDDNHPLVETLVTIIVMLTLYVLDANSIVYAPLAGFVAATAFVLYMPSSKRDAISSYRPLEEVGKKSHGLYLMNLIVLSLMLIVIRALLPDLLDNQVLVQPILFAAGRAIPLIVMDITVRSLARPVYRYVFG